LKHDPDRQNNCWKNTTQCTTHNTTRTQPKIGGELRCSGRV